MKLVTLVLATVVVACYGSEELIKNGMFEYGFHGNWNCNGCDLSQSTDAFKGRFSGQVTNRQGNWAGLSQNIPAQGGKRYFFAAMVKYTRQPNWKIFQNMEIMLEVDYYDGQKQYMQMAMNPLLREADGWQPVKGDFKLHNKGVRSCRLYFQTPDAHANYNVDVVSVKEVPHNPNWRAEADARIERYRKGNVELKVEIEEFSPAELEIKIEQQSHDFKFGSAVEARIIGDQAKNNPSWQKYRDYFYRMFNIATLENAHKWHEMERQRYQINYDWSENALKEFEKKGVPLRGHAVYWGVEGRVNDWLKPLSGEEVKRELVRRRNYLFERFGGRCVHWDVNNELLNGQWYEEKTRDPDLLQDMLRGCAALDPKTELFLNDFRVLATGALTGAYTALASKMKSQGVPLHGLGLQCYFRQDQPLDIELLQRRLETIAGADLPMWVTEFTVKNHDVGQRARDYVDAMRMFFSQPKMKGILLWGFWNQAQFDQNMSLLDGPNLTPNEAGRAYENLVRNEWMTKENFKPSQMDETFNFRGFHGGYKATVYRLGREVSSQDFYVSPNTDTKVVIKA